MLELYAQKEAMLKTTNLIQHTLYITLNINFNKSLDLCIYNYKLKIISC